MIITNPTPGAAIRLQRIWKHRRAVIIPYDHGAYSGVVPGLEDPLKLTERIARTNADAVLVTPASSGSWRLRSAGSASSSGSTGHTRRMRPRRPIIVRCSRPLTR